MINYLKKNKLYLIYIPLAIYWLVLFIATSLPSNYVPSVGVGDKFNHFFAYMVLSVFLFFTFAVQGKYKVLNNYPGIMTIIIASLYGVFDELHQMLIPGRSAEFLDWVADFLGVCCGVLISRYIYEKFSKEYQSDNIIKK